MSKSRLFVLSIFTLIVCSYACSSLRHKREEGNFMENISTRYNILYNSRQIIQQLEKNTDQHVSDNYETLLPVFKKPNITSIEANQALADSLIEKCDRIIDEKTNSKYVGDAFLFKALAYYYTGEYFRASEFARYVAENFPRYRLQGRAYQALSFIRLESYASAKSILDSVQNITPDSPAYALLQGVKALYALDTQQPSNARMALAQGLTKIKKGSGRLRWFYLLGQLNQQAGNLTNAYDYFREVVKSNVSYEMAFYANLNCIEIARQNKPDLQAKREQLERLLKDNKNKEFKGLIYERIGDVYVTSDETEKAEEQYTRGLREVTTQAPWQAQLYTKLADLHFAQRQYSQAVLYYDSAMMAPASALTSPKMDDYRRFKRLAANQHQIIAQNDSLQTFALLPSEERKSWTDSISLKHYQQLLPDSPKGIAALTDSTKKALLTLADVYQHGLQDTASAKKQYILFIERFPDQAEAALAYYQLYTLSQGESAQAVLYRNQLLSSFPTSKYARFILQPTSSDAKTRLLKDFNEQYIALYQLYTRQQYDSVASTIGKLLQSRKYASLPSLPQLEYLSILAHGRTGTPADFKETLLRLVQTYPEDSLVVPVAKQQIDFIEKNEDTFLQRPTALLSFSPDDHTQRKEVILTPWPELTFQKQYASYEIERKNFNDISVQSVRIQRQNTDKKELRDPKWIQTGQIGEIRHENSYRNLKILPDSAQYYFVINVMHPTVNLSPSRFGIGQFNRGHYPNQKITHQLKVAGDENQLIYIGVFHTFNEVKTFETKISPLLKQIMKIPETYYNSFVITETNLNTLDDVDKIDQYYTTYKESDL